MCAADLFILLEGRAAQLAACERSVFWLWEIASRFATLTSIHGMWRGGNSQSGFDVSYDTARRILFLRMWGLWDEPLAARYRDTVLTAMRPLTSTRPSYVLADLVRYPTQKPAVQKYHAELMGKSASHGIRRSANLVATTLTSMQIRRLSQESGIAEFSFFQDEAKAIEWLLSGAAADENAVAKLPGLKRE
jgi:hypothetical protein